MTLLELVIALSLVALLVGIGSISYVAGEDERALRRTASQLEALSSRGHAMAVLYQKPFWLRIEETKVLLIGADTEAPPPVDDGFTSWEEMEERETMEVVYDEFDLDTEVSLRRWGVEEALWVRPVEEEFVTWQFQRSGLCEPVSLKIEHEGNWIIMHMHPLTARVDEEEMHIE